MQMEWLVILAGIGIISSLLDKKSNSEPSASKVQPKTRSTNEWDSEIQGKGIIPGSSWDRLRKSALARDKYTCSSCGRKLKAWLDEQEITTRSGRPVPVSSALAMLINPFYYGEFQYPEGPGNPWYKGAHKPLVSKELWNEVQQSRGVNKGIWGSKQFAFRGLLKCGRCGAEVTAQEKIKLLKKTGVHKRFVYYNCTRKVDPNCKEKYINEDLLCELLEPLIEKEVKKIRVTPKLQAKIDRHYAVAQNILRQYGVERPPATPLVEYSRYVLRSGSETEKTAFANGITNKVAVKNGALRIS